MKTINFGIILLVFFLFGCEKYEGNLVQVTIDPDPFTEINVKANAKIFLEQGPYFSIVVEGYETFIDDYLFNVNDETLWITQFNGRQRRGTKIYITIPDLWLLENQGSADITYINRMTLNHDLIVINDGNGDLNLSLDVHNLYLEMFGSGNIWIDGFVNYQEIDINGSGDYEGYNLDSYEARIRIFGSGDAHVWVQSYLYAKIRGSGDLYYQGFPLVDYSILGSGDIIDMN